MSFYQATAGQSFEARIDVASRTGLSATFLPGYPRATLREGQDVILQVLGIQSVPTTEYVAAITVPRSLNFQGRDFLELEVEWDLRTQMSGNFAVTQVVHVFPDSTASDPNVTPLVLDQDTALSLALPYALAPTDTAPLSIYRFNLRHENDAGPVADVVPSSITSYGMTSVAQYDISTLQLRASLSPYNLIVRGTRGGSPYAYSVSLWVFNPSILTAMSQLEQMLRKSKIENVISSLNYTQADLAFYMSRGLFWFNSYPPALTSFNGTDMRGMLLNAWLLCSQYYALMAQLLAENDLGFDFSGQSVTLRVDRVPNIESMMSKIEAELDRTIRPMKQLLAKAGHIGGNGEVGDPDGSGQSLQSPNSMGRVIAGNHSMLNVHVRYPNRQYNPFNIWRR